MGRCCITEKQSQTLGINRDSVASHKKFEKKYGLPFTLLSDTSLDVLKKYDVWKEKTNYGNALRLLGLSELIF